MEDSLLVFRYIFYCIYFIVKERSIPYYFFKLTLQSPRLLSR